MGNAKYRLEKKRQEQPNCIFCGGSNEMQSIDHIPPISMFTGRARPKGLEFPACLHCNNGSKLNDNILALLSRMHSSEQGTDAYTADVATVMKSIANNFPELLHELNANSHDINSIELPESLQLEDGGGLIYADGPIVQNAIREIGAKIGLALHYERTGRIVPLSGGVCTILTTNLQAMTQGLSQEILHFFPHEKTLIQGKNNVSDQFTYATLQDERPDITAHWVTFRQAMALEIFVVEDLDSLLAQGIFKEEHFVRPGWLRN